jgi:hypothetical protein
MFTPWMTLHDSDRGSPDAGRMCQAPSVEPVRFTCHSPLPSRPPGTNGLAIAGMTLGIVSLLMWWSGLLVLVMLSIVFSSTGIHNANLDAPHKGMAVAGLACGITGALGYPAFGVASAGIGFIL